MVGNGSQARRVRARALETSAIAMALVLGRPAFAQCAPDATPANGGVTCSGIAADGPGLVADAALAGAAQDRASDSFAVVVTGDRFENDGTIAAPAGGVRFGSDSRYKSGAFINTGTITAGGTGVSLYGPSFDNSGTIRSTGGIGAVVYTSADSINSGSIEGATVGASVGDMLANTGSIRSAGTGVLLDPSSLFDNRAGGIVTGGRIAIRTADYGYNTTVVNAGTINGDVDFDRTSSGGYGGHRYFSLAGGVLNGNLSLGAYGTLVISLANTGPGAFSGITGAVTASNSLLRYRVHNDVTATLEPPAGFTKVGYDLYDNAALTLAGATTLPLTFAGTGSVDLTADITVTGIQPTISVTSVLVAPGETAPPQGQLSITSHGTLRLDRVDGSESPHDIVVPGSGNDFTNAGTIAVGHHTSRDHSPIVAIDSGNLVTNSGTITLDAAIGVADVVTLVNTGSILQAAGGGKATGVLDVATLVNSGTIDVAGTAVLASYLSSKIVNSGRIASSGAQAITIDPNGYAYHVGITNLAGGTIAGGAGKAAIALTASLDNAGTIIGSVDLGFSLQGRSAVQSFYFADGGTIAGDLRFGTGNDTLIALNDVTGVSGTIDGGAGDDLFIHARDTSGTVALGLPTVRSFELQGIRALGADTIVTANATDPVVSDVYVSGDGNIVNTATIDGVVWSMRYGFAESGGADPLLASFTNQGSILGGFIGATRSFSNSGTIGSASLGGTSPTSTSSGVSITVTTDLAFSNSGRITGNDGFPAVVAESYGGSVAATNSGSIEGGLFAASVIPFADPDTPPPPLLAIAMDNSGSISSGTQALALKLIGQQGGSGTLSLANSGTIEATGVGGAGAVLVMAGVDDPAGPASIGVVNSGAIRANGGGDAHLSDAGFGDLRSRYAGALELSADVGTLSVSNTATGVIEATGERSVAVLAYDADLDLNNAGTIRGGAGTTLAAGDGLASSLGSSYLAGAIQTVGGADDRIVNTGTILGSIALGGGSDRIENRGTLQGDVFLGTGDDSFLEQASATLSGTVDGGEGTDSLVIDATGGGRINGDQFVNFERFSQIGEGDVTYSGTFRFNTIGVAGGSVTVDAGQTLTSAGPVTVTGSDAAETVVNDGTIAGSVDLAGGDDRVVNAGAILGSVSLGSGDDAFVERAGSRVAGGVEGGAGNDLYTVVLAGDRSGIGRRTGFERLGVEGTGSLSLRLDQDFASIALTGTGLALSLAGHRVGAVSGSDAAESFAADGDVASVALGGGDDQLSLGATRAAGRYDGGAGSDVLRFTAAGPVTLAGTATGFERLVLAGKALTVTGTLGGKGAPLAFGDGDQQLTLAGGGTLAGAIDLGTGNDAFRWEAGGVLDGTVAGGSGSDVLTIALAGDRTLASGVLTGFETLATEGSGTLSLTGSHAYDLVAANGDLSVAAGSALTAAQVRFGAGDNRLSIAGQFAGAVDGGAGSDTIAVSGGSAGAPVAFGAIAGVERFDMASGYASIAGSASLGSVDLAGGRLVGLGGSTIHASQITVRQGATFGSAGTVDADIAVAGILSPGASPGTMAVNGTVALQAGSTSLFELTSTVSDKLVVDGTVSIAPGATLEIVPIGTLRPGASYELITASGGITGSYTTLVKPDTLFGILVQRTGAIELLGQFQNDARFSPQVGRSVAYANAQLTAQPATSPFFAAIPALLTATGASNPIAFAQLTPEAYASASQIGVDNALTLTEVARAPGFAASGDTVHAYTFAQTVGGWHRLGGNSGAGTSDARGHGYGFLGGIGVGDAAWSIGAFAGYLNERQQVDALGARTKADGFVAGIQGRYVAGGLGLAASVLYDGGDARTQRALPGGGSAVGRYGLHSWAGDVSLGYGVEMASGWTLRSHAGIRYVRTTRGAVAEAGASPFALTVARDRLVAGFADVGVGFGRSDASDAALRPFVSLGARYQIQGQRADALAGYSGGGLGLVALGAQRARLVGTAAAGIGYRLQHGLDLFASAASQTGRDDHDESVTGGVRLQF